MRILECPDVANLCRIEYRDVGHAAVAETPMIGKPETGGGHSGHLMNRLLERDRVLVASVVAEHARKCPVRARVRNAVAGFARRPSLAIIVIG